MSDIKRTRRGVVSLIGVRAGVITETTDGASSRYAFQYDASYKGAPIGHHYPLQAAPFISDALPPFFENLTSEGWIRSHQTAKARVDKSDSFGLLLANGNELIGAVSIVPLET